MKALCLLLLFLGIGCVSRQHQVTEKPDQMSKELYYNKYFFGNETSFCLVRFWTNDERHTYYLIPDSSDSHNLKVIRLLDGENDDFGELNLDAVQFEALRERCNHLMNDSAHEERSFEYPFEMRFDLICYHNGPLNRTMILDFPYHQYSKLYIQNFGLIKSIILEFEIAYPRRKASSANSVAFPPFDSE